MKKRLISVILGISVLCSVLPSAAAEYGYYGGAELAAEITVTLNPTDRTVISGSKAYFEVAAAGGGTLSYQWYSSESSDGAGTAIEGADKNIYTVTASSENSGKYFYCVISNNTTKAESRRALLTTQYKISYDANGGVDAPISQYKLHDQNIAISIFKPEYFAHTFLGWSDRANASTAQYRPGDDISLNKNTILYAVWRSAKQQYNVTSFNDTVTTEVGGEKNYFMFSPSESGVYAFESSAPYGQDTYGEIYSSNGVLLADNDDCMLINDNTRNFRVYSNLVAGKVYYLSAEYYSATAVGSFGVALRKQYTLSYDSNGGGGADEPQNILTGENYSVSEEQPEREGFTFLGWSENKAAVEAAYKPGDKVSGGRDVTLYAVWENDSYKVTYNFSYNGGISVTESSKRVEPGGAVDLTPTAQKYGWDFVGWNTDPDETTGIKSLNATGNI
ncbi:MAG: InlB B-repeat-containing protein, partial [Candidatus Ornithomonoglobus sp.]